MGAHLAPGDVEDGVFVRKPLASGPRLAGLVAQSRRQLPRRADACQIALLVRDRQQLAVLYHLDSMGLDAVQCTPESF